MKYKYIKQLGTRQGSVKIITDLLILKENNMPIIVQLDFDYYTKDSANLIQLLYGQIDSFTSNYGNHDTFRFDKTENALIKEYKAVNKKLNNQVCDYEVKFKLTEELKSELINYIMEKANDRAQSEVSRRESKIKAKGSQQLDNIKSSDQQQSNIQQQKDTINKMDTEIKSQEGLRDFSEFNSVMEIDTYLRTNNNAAAFIKWLQDNKLITLNHTYAPQELAKKPVEELNRLRQKYLNKNWD